MGMILLLWWFDVSMPKNFGFDFSTVKEKKLSTLDKKKYLCN